MTVTAAQELGALIDVEYDGLVKLRHDLHQHPQLAYEETYASGCVQEVLSALGVPFEAGLAETGVVAWLEPTGGAAAKRDALALRADMDALPITEQTKLAYASAHEGLMHACGHDGHTTVLLGTAMVLHRLRDHLARPVKLIFQPAEEGLAGAKKLVEAGVLTDAVGGHNVSHVFGLHGWPQLEVGTVGCADGVLMASTDRFVITVRGRGAHGAAPHHGADPVTAASQIVGALQTIVSRNTDPTDAAVVTVGTFNAGQAPNIIPESATLTGTIRTLNKRTASLVHRRISEIAEGVAAGMDCAAEVEIQHGYPPTVNDPACAEYVLDTARRVLGKTQSIRFDRPHMVGEDFAFYSEGTTVKGGFYYLGLRPTNRDKYPGLHTPTFDFNDAAIQPGVRMMCELALDADRLDATES